ncbi:hypothetical protein NHX12_014313 [Muraenolepis orangiensis]|uniref:Uncharacterized protein n=1 Tax=Muraenolepis orangiensis TaxID=630683 RepID=A0A9Q0I4G9_9TELE|nr:hypothetical protein NHX12_014313 [Muraenolepis orangiensis]
MEKDFQSAQKRFCQTIRRLRRGKRGSIQAVYSKSGTLLTSTEEVIGQWKEHFEELLNPTTPSMVETELEDKGRQTSISLEEVTAVVKHLESGKAPGVDEISVPFRYILDGFAFKDNREAPSKRSPPVTRSGLQTGTERQLHGLQHNPPTETCSGETLVCDDAV